MATTATDDRRRPTTVHARPRWLALVPRRRLDAKGNEPAILRHVAAPTEECDIGAVVVVRVTVAMVAVDGRGAACFAVAQRRVTSSRLDVSACIMGHS